MITPPDTPPKTPVDASMLPTAGLLLLHTPPGVASLMVVVVPWHIADAPVMGAVGDTTVTVVVDRQPVGAV